MIKLIIPTDKKKKFQDLFKFFYNNECELCIFPDGLKFRNHCSEGIVYKGAFAEYPFNFRRKLKMVISEKKNLLIWFNTWKDKVVEDKIITEIPVA